MRETGDKLSRRARERAPQYLLTPGLTCKLATPTRGSSAHYTQAGVQRGGNLCWNSNIH